MVGYDNVWIYFGVMFGSVWIMNDVVVVMIGIFWKSLNYKGDSVQNFIFIILFTSLLNFKWG